MSEEENKQLSDEVEKYKLLARTLHEQLKSVAQKGESFKISIISKNALIKKLEEDVEKRDKIIECYTSQNVDCVKAKQGEGNPKISFEMAVDGKRIFEIQNKQKYPYMIKLSPMKQAPKDNETNVTEAVESGEPMQHLAGASNNDNYYYSISPESDKTEELEDFSTASTYKPLEITKSKSSTSFSFSTPSRSIGKKSKSRFEDDAENCNSSYRMKIQKTVEESKRESSKRILDWGERNSKSSSTSTKTKSRFQDDVKVFKSDASVLNIPESLRFNYGTLDWELGDCEIGQKFWFDNRNAHMTKFFLKLHSDYNSWGKSSYFILKEQIGLSTPQTHYMKFHDILKKLETTPNKRIWLHVRDFNLFSEFAQDTLGCASIEPAIVNFSFSDRLYSDKRFNASHVLEFIFKHLINLEYCSINNGALYNKGDFEYEDAEPVKYIRELPKLKTIRLIHSKLQFSLSFITQLVNMSKNLDSFYGFPLNHIEKLCGRKLLEKGSIRSLYIKRDSYNLTEVKALYFLNDLSYLDRQEKLDMLDEFDTRSFFLECKAATRSLCLEKISEIIKNNSNFLSKLKLGIYSTPNEWVTPSSELKIPRLKNLKTLRLDMNHKNKRFEKPPESLSFFPMGFDIKTNFPKLSKVILFMEFANGARHDFHQLPQVMFNKYFPQDMFKPGVSFDGVECLILHGFVVLECIPQIAELFPSVKRLCLHDNLRQITKVLPSCYQNWTNLKQIILETSSERYYNLDSALTGLEEDRCDKLRLNSSREEVERSIKKYGKELSICHLTDLELLRIVLHPAANMDLSKHPVVSRCGALALFPLFDSGEKRGKEFVLEIAFDERVMFREKQLMINAHSPILQLKFVVLER